MSPEAILEALALADLTDAAAGPHAMQLLVHEIVSALRARWRIPIIVWRAPPITSAAENYDALGYPPGGAARDARYTRWIDGQRLLRTQTSAMVPAALRALPAPDDVLLACPGLTWRRDRVDRLHLGAPHQLDLWRISARPLEGLRELAEVVLAAALPGRAWRSNPTAHPYTSGGLELEVEDGGGWVEVGECGKAGRAVLDAAGLTRHHGLAMGLGLDRLLALRKGIPDLRLLRSTDPRALPQLEDLSPWRPWSRQPAVQRDLSIAAREGVTAEELGDRVREALGAEAQWVEEVALVEATPAAALSEAVRARLGLAGDQVNALVRITLRHPSRTLTAEEANALRSRLWAALSAMPE